MSGRDNRIAEFHKHELEELGRNVRKLLLLQQSEIHVDALAVDTMMSEWKSEDDFSGDQLMAVADSLNFNQLDWLVSGDADNRPFGTS